MSPRQYWAACPSPQVLETSQAVMATKHILTPSERSRSSSLILMTPASIFHSYTSSLYGWLRVGPSQTSTDAVRDAQTFQELHLRGRRACLRPEFVMSHRTITSGHSLPALAEAPSQCTHSRCIRSPFRSSLQISDRRTHRIRCNGTETKAGETRRQALGSIVIETSEDLPEPPEKDFWEGGAWEVWQLLAFLSSPYWPASSL